MFGIGGKKEEPRLVGAKEKLRKADMLKRGRLSDHIEGKGEGKQAYGTVVVLIYILSVTLAFLLQIGAMKNTGLNLHIGLPGLDRILFGAGVPSVTGNMDQDMFIVPAMRGTVIFLVGGVMPLLTLLWIRAIDKPNMNPFIAVWGVSIGAFMTFFFCRDFFGPLLGQVLEILSP